MKTVLYIFAIVSAVGLVLSIATHIAALAGTQGPLGDHTPVLHVGAIALGLPVVLVVARLARNVPRKDLWKAALRGCPRLMRYMTYGFFGYAVLNFVLFALTSPRGGGTGPMPPQVVRGFSAHWMAFYSISLAVMYSAAQVWDQGHTIIDRGRSRGDVPPQHGRPGM
jgi:hypothetical protein